MEHYELLAIVSSKVLENEVDSILEKIKAEITAENGEITLTKNLGKKKFSYPLAQMRYGYYILLEFNFDQPQVKSLDKKLSLEGSIIRHQIIKVREKTAEEIKNLAREKIEKPLPAVKKTIIPIPPQTPETARIEIIPDALPKIPQPSRAASLVEPTSPFSPSSLRARAPLGPVSIPTQHGGELVAEKSEPRAKPKQKEEKKITLEELDEKLDKILEDDIMNE